ncbi:MAG: carboxypeptidase-like regulatory domain-containing protein, partial [Planctomycetaceae bacterium]|nr:carboxypeptidase-like regulatory domain-containing protein [Planctomycetaceae bacterium]
GKVTFEDGSPLTQGGIAFSTATFMADGKIRADGSFTLTSSKPGDGLPPGNYIVTISASETDDKERTIYLVDPKFGDVTTSPFTAEVSADQKKFDFTVSKPK